MDRKALLARGGWEISLCIPVSAKEILLQKRFEITWKFLTAFQLQVMQFFLSLLLLLCCWFCCSFLHPNSICWEYFTFVKHLRITTQSIQTQSEKHTRLQPLLWSWSGVEDFWVSLLCSPYLASPVEGKTLWASFLELSLKTLPLLFLHRPQRWQGPEVPPERQPAAKSEVKLLEKGAVL